ncbi:MAG TPA: Trp biosynthesis-associated membrane protein [Terrimesophilobacter sp.]|jgi:Tryptophan-associated transmembrane protein (Trp_oprn_chp).|uniref:Trp biosynthesis-associated membrane protein n=1 Tax=Terrimesophilobacter sp. TaxID=2906435 RepID=UPI002F95CA9F
MTGRRLKTMSIVAGVVFAGLALLSWTQTWFVVVLGGQAAGHAPIAADGSVGAPAVSALALACLAGIGAMAISGPFFRAVLAVLQLVIGACIVLSAALALSSPVSAVLSLVTEATGVAGTGPAAELIDSVAATVWPWASLLSGALLAALGIVILATGRRWPGSSRKYQPVRLEEAEGSDSAVSDWDSLSGGSDPTSR